MSKKRSIESFFGTAPKKARVSELADQPARASNHKTYPFPIPELPENITQELNSLPARPGRVINDQPDLNLLYYEPFIPHHLATPVFNFLRAELPFYRVEYSIKRGGISTNIRTPRFTTVFGVDATAAFEDDGSTTASGNVVLVDATTHAPLPATAFPAGCRPRPLPACLKALRRATEAATGCRFNICLVNYYASGADSISFHSDDERFLGAEPAIASFSLGARRDFLMKHKPVAPPAPTQAAPTAAASTAPSATTFKQMKLPLGSGDMVLMRGPTQAHWLHSIPKRTGKNEHDGGRINITFRRALVKGGTANYYHYNVGAGPVYKWDSAAREMRQWNK